MNLVHPELLGVGLAIFAWAFAITFLLVPVARRLAIRFGVIDSPGPRKVHHQPTPRAGGIAVFIAFTSVVVTGYWLIDVLATMPWLSSALGESLRLLVEAHKVEGKLAAVIVGGALAFAVGLTDDVLGRRFPVQVKAAGQVLAATILVASGVRISFLPYEWLGYAVAVLWIVGITNAFNLIDNMDGLSAGVALVASLVLLVNAWTLGEFFVSLILLAFMGALAAFLVFNFQPASIFLGDCGSHFIGYTLASLTLLERYVPKQADSQVSVLLPVLVLAVPILDTATVIVIRLREGRPIYVGDQRHLSHQLVAIGFSQRAAVLFIYLLTFTLGLGALTLTDTTPWRSALVLVQSTCFISIILILTFGRVPAPEQS